jgi:hypothetical protein
MLFRNSFMGEVVSHCAVLGELACFLAFLVALLDSRGPGNHEGLSVPI